MNTDISYLACNHFVENRDKFYPQFATHNANTVAAVRVMAGDNVGYEFQRLHEWVKPTQTNDWPKRT